MSIDVFPATVLNATLWNGQFQSLAWQGQSRGDLWDTARKCVCQ